MRKIDWEVTLLKVIVTVLTVAMMVVEAAANDWRPSFGLSLLITGFLLGVWLVAPKERKK